MSEKRKILQYSISDVDKAIEEVKSGRLSTNAAAKVYEIPRKTFIRKIEGKEG